MTKSSRGHPPAVGDNRRKLAEQLYTWHRKPPTSLPGLRFESMAVTRFDSIFSLTLAKIKLGAVEAPYPRALVGWSPRRRQLPWIEELAPPLLGRQGIAPGRDIAVVPSRQLLVEQYRQVGRVPLPPGIDLKTCKAHV